MSAVDPTPGPAGERRGGAAGLFALLVVTALVQLWFASNKGLVLDEFHSHFHATRQGWAAFWETLVQDNHPPLSFLVIGACARLLGDGELALRLPAMVFALAEITLIWRLLRDHGRTSALLAALLLAASSLHLDFGTQARMYALHGLAVTGCAAAIIRLLSGDGTRRTSLALGLWFWIGLHNHYFFVQYSAGLAVGALLAAGIEPAVRARLRALLVPLACAVLLALPWYLTGFRTQWEHALPPGGDDLGLGALVEAYVHLFFLNVRLGSEVPFVGAFLHEFFILCGAALTFSALLGVWAGLSRKESPRLRVTTAVLASLAFLVPCAAFLLANFLPRSGFTWHYILPSAAAEAGLIAIGWRAGAFLRARRATTALALAAAILLSFLNARGPGSEDYPAAIASILNEHKDGDAIISVEWQPPLFPQGMPWDYYAPRLKTDPPARLPMNAHFSLLDPMATTTAARVWVLRTSLPEDQHLFRLLAGQQQAEIRREDHGFGIQVLLFK